MRPGPPHLVEGRSDLQDEEEVRRVSSLALINILTAVWFVGAVPVSLVVERVIRRRRGKLAQSRPSAVAGRHRRRPVSAGEQWPPPAGPAQPGAEEPVVEAADVPNELVESHG
jgi:hypothetical protein